MGYHFVGIGGIGMSSLANILLDQKKKVKGSDIKSNDIIKELIKRGVKISIGHKKENVQKEDTIIYSSAIEEENEEILLAKKHNLEILHRSQLLNLIAKDKKSILISGTHGKTTTTALLSQVLIDARKDPSYSIGGILKSNNKNGFFTDGKYFVLEADESDGSFLNYKGFGAILTNVEKEHLSYWKNFDNLKKGFLSFSKNIENKNHFFWCFNDPVLRSLKLQGISYGFSNIADIYASNIRQNEFFTIFDIHFKGKVFKDIKIKLIGNHNVLNATAVFGMALSLGIDQTDLRKTFLSFSNVKRRLDKIGESKKVLFFDDYAHHPTEINSTLKALKSAILERKTIAIFQPHRYSRTKELFDGFTFCFKKADVVIITDIYSAGEKEIKNINGKKVSEKICHPNVLYVPREKIESFLLNFLRPHDVAIFLGAGDISNVCQNVFHKFKRKKSKLKIALICGGKSKEHEVSIASAKNVYKNLDKSIYDIEIFKIDKKGNFILLDENFSFLKDCSKKSLEKMKNFDVCFPLVHGSFGEDGMLPGFFETLKLAYVGSDYKASAICMNKVLAKYIAKQNGIKVAKFIEVRRNFWLQEKSKFLEKIEKTFSFPIFIKPANLGSSIGVFKCKNQSAISRLIEKIFLLDDVAIVEQEIIGQEIEFALFGNEKVFVATSGEILSQGEIFSYRKKYGINFSGKDGTFTQIPANLSKKDILTGKKIALRLYKLIGCSGFARIDFFFKDSTFYFSEINTIPGLTLASLYVKMWEASNINMKSLLDKLIILAIHKKYAKTL